MKIARRLIACALLLALLTLGLCSCVPNGNFVKMHIKTADGEVDEMEQADFEQILIELEPVVAAAMSLRYATEG